jgi:hypothetical protein
MGRHLLAFMMIIGIPAAAATCESLSTLGRQGTTITTAESVTGGSFTPPVGAAIERLPAFCRVSGVIKPSSDSEIMFEVWLPSTGWNGKFYGVGNGGFAGSITFPGLASALRRGFATAATDTGHAAGVTDAKWALGHHEKVVDFGYRAVHETADTAKAVIAAFYSDGPKKSYFSSCSNGGREALMEAQRYPADYDGIVAGAPANNWTHLLAAGTWEAQALVSDPASYIPSAKLPAIEAAALNACDANDNPAQCHFDPSVLLCNGADSDTCLTEAQLATLKKIYSGPQDSKGKPMYLGYSPGGEPGGNGWGGWITGAGSGNSLQYGFGTNFFKYMVFDNPDWDIKTFSVEHDMKVAEDKVGQILNATDANLKRFRDRGGKLIVYHGWSDAAIPPMNAIDYYKNVVSKMGAKQTDAFVRLYMVPGMQHCGGGPGPNNFGQTSDVDGDPRHDIGRAVEQWVENGVAPQQIIATKYKTGSNPASGVERTRPLCPYPRVAQWKGSGSTDDAANFTCVAGVRAAK